MPGLKPLPLPSLAILRSPLCSSCDETCTKMGPLKPSPHVWATTLFPLAVGRSLSGGVIGASLLEKTV